MTHTRAKSTATDEYEKRMERQAQSAMDAAFAHPVTRLFFGVLCLLTLMMMVVEVFEHLRSDEVWWQKAISVIGTPIIFGFFALEVGCISAFGKSRSRCFENWSVRRRSQP